MTEDEKDFDKDFEKNFVVVDIRQELLEFWLGCLKDAPDHTDKLKASENLAKYFLVEGQKKVKVGVPKRPATSDILKLVEQHEKGMIERVLEEADFPTSEDDFGEEGVGAQG